MRITISAPNTFVEKLNNHVTKRNVSRFLVEAAEEKLEREKRLKAMDELRKHGPAFPQIKDASAYVRALRDDDEDRANQLGI